MCHISPLFCWGRQGFSQEVGDNSRFMAISLPNLQHANSLVSSGASAGGVSLVVSIVSHGHGALVQRLLQQIAQLNSGYVSRVVLTLNLPELEPEGCWPFTLDIRRNLRPIGFGANHNAALQDATEAFVCVLNPDVELLEEPFGGLIEAASQRVTDWGGVLSYPVQVDADGQAQSSERALPSPKALFLRWALGRKDARVDWVNAACMVLSLGSWRKSRGFDESYHMYCEDVDFCLRLRLAGGQLIKAPVRVVHVGERASSRSWRHLGWHISSLVRLWRSPVYQQARNLVTLAGVDARRMGGS